MKTYTIQRLINVLGGSTDAFSGDLLERAITGVSTDSRTIRDGEVFFALWGDRFDGADYVDQAIARGALCAVVNRDSMQHGAPDLPLIPVDDTVRALGQTARDYRSLFSCPVVAVTGTTGKTTVKEMMRAVLGKRFNVHCTEGNYNNHIGLPLSVLGLEDAHECAVFELGMNAPGEIAYLAGIARPQIGVILNVGPAHMEFFSSLEAVADAKMELLEALESDGTAVVNGDDWLLKKAETRTKSRLVRFGLNGKWDYGAGNVEINPDGCATFDVAGHRVTLHIPGQHNVYNALAAFTVGMLLGVSESDAAEALGSFAAPSMRLEIEERNGVKYINDTYNANPMSMKCSAEVLKSINIPNGGSKIAVLGTMLELGDFSVDAHIRTGMEFAGLGLSWLCLVGEHAADYKTGALDCGMDPKKILSFPDADAAARFIRKVRHTGDVILVKGSRGMKMEKVLSE